MPGVDPYVAAGRAPRGAHRGRKQGPPDAGGGEVIFNSCAVFALGRLYRNSLEYFFADAVVARWFSVVLS